LALSLAFKQGKKKKRLNQTPARLSICRYRFAKLLFEYHIRSYVKPGITGLAQVRKFHGQVMKPADIEARLESDLVYVENWSLILDCSIILRTFWQLFFPPALQDRGSASASILRNCQRSVVRSQYSQDI
jgi:hypothetical protein